MAKHYMFIAGYNIDYTPSASIKDYANLLAATTIIFATLILTHHKKKKDKM